MGTTTTDTTTSGPDTSTVSSATPAAARAVHDRAVADAIVCTYGDRAARTVTSTALPTSARRIVQHHEVLATTAGAVKVVADGEAWTLGEVVACMQRHYDREAVEAIRGATV